MDPQTLIPLANLIVLIGIYVQISNLRARLSSVETWMASHKDQDDERHEDMKKEVKSVRVRQHDLANRIQAIYGKDVRKTYESEGEE